ncbi:MAG: Rab family GTPase [Candidatus Hodarchaeota archaeon]
MGSKIPFYKICIVGDFGVGKTTLLHQYLERRFNPDVSSTIGSNFFVKIIKMQNVKDPITLQIWDLAGQEHFKWVRLGFYKGAKGIVYVFDLTNKNTFDNIFGWKNEIEKAIKGFSSILVGNKLDLINDDNKIIIKKDSEILKKKLKACAYHETSAKIGTGVEEFFTKLVSRIYKSSKE